MHDLAQDYKPRPDCVPRSKGDYNEKEQVAHSERADDGFEHWG
jgi:hypothetical protein